MVAFVAPAALTKSERSVSPVASGGLAARPEWQRESGGFAMNYSSIRSERPMQADLPPLAVPKPERQLHREREGDLCLHGGKRAKLQEPVPCPVSQNFGRPCGLPFSSSGLAHGMGGGSGLASRYPPLPLPLPMSSLRRNNPMLPPAPVMMAPPAECNPLEEPSPLGLTLRKTPSLLDLITLQLQNNANAQSAESEVAGPGMGKSRVGKCSAPTGSGTQDKLKASNFPASTLKIGTWERSSRYEGDLVAKCYYAKRKLVWEVLDNGLKSKVEIQWSDISAMKATCPDNLPGSLEIEVSRPPLFFKETNPQPRKHTLWQATTDFTGGQASVNKVHYLQFPEGVLNRHYEKLVQCDPRLKALVEGTLTGSVSRCDASDSVTDLQLGKPRTCMGHVYDGLNDGMHSPLSPVFRYSHTPVGGVCPGAVAELESDGMRRSELASPSSVMELRRCEDGGDSDSGSGEYYAREEVGGYSSYAVDSAYSPSQGYDMQEIKANVFPGGVDLSASNREILDEIAQLLLGDSSASLSSEQAILLAAQMGSMQAAIGSGLIPQPGFDVHPASEGRGAFYGASCGRSVVAGDGQAETNFDTDSMLPKNCSSMLESSFNSVVQGLPKNFSTGDLLMNLPRVASLPQLFESVSQVPLSRYMGIQ